MRVTFGAINVDICIVFIFGVFILVDFEVQLVVDVAVVLVVNVRVNVTIDEKVGIELFGIMSTTIVITVARVFVLVGTAIMAATTAATVCTCVIGVAVVIASLLIIAPPTSSWQLYVRYCACGHPQIRAIAIGHKTNIKHVHNLSNFS